MNSYPIFDAAGRIDVEAAERQARQMRAEAVADGLKRLARWLRARFAGRRAPASGARSAA